MGKAAGLEEAREEGRFEDDEDFPQHAALGDAAAAGDQGWWARASNASNGTKFLAGCVALALVGMVATIAGTSGDSSNLDDFQAQARSANGGDTRLENGGLEVDDFEGDCGFETRCQELRGAGGCVASGPACEWDSGECSFSAACRCFDVPEGSQPEECALIEMRGECNSYAACTWDSPNAMCLKREACPRTNPPTTDRPTASPSAAPTFETAAKEDCEYDPQQPCVMIRGRTKCQDYSACKWQSNRCVWETNCLCWDQPSSDLGGCGSAMDPVECDAYAACTWEQVDQYSANGFECKLRSQCPDTVVTDRNEPSASPSQAPSQAPSKSPQEHDTTGWEPSGSPSAAPTDWPTSAPVGIGSTEDTPTHAPSASPVKKGSGWNGRL